MNIPTASEMRASQINNDDFEKACSSVLKEIEKAKNGGKRQVHFDPRPWQQYDAVKNAFKEKGYYFTPTGYIGGVWQLTENINW